MTTTDTSDSWAAGAEAAKDWRPEPVEGPKPPIVAEHTDDLIGTINRLVYPDVPDLPEDPHPDDPPDAPPAAAWWLHGPEIGDEPELDSKVIRWDSKFPNDGVEATLRWFSQYLALRGYRVLVWQSDGGPQRWVPKLLKATHKVTVCTRGGVSVEATVDQDTLDSWQAMVAERTGLILYSEKPTGTGYADDIVPRLAATEHSPTHGVVQRQHSWQVPARAVDLLDVVTEWAPMPTSWLR